MVLPNGPVVNYFDITHRTNPGADSTAVAFFVGLKVSVRQGDQFANMYFDISFPLTFPAIFLATARELPVPENNRSPCS
jgi:hypothetical protein